MIDRLNFDKEIHKIISVIGQDNFISEICWWFDKDLLDDFCSSIKSEYNIK